MPKVDMEALKKFLAEALKNAGGLPTGRDSQIPAMLLKQTDLTYGQKIVLEEFIRSQLQLDVMTTVEIVYEKETQVAAVYIPARWERMK